MTKGDTYVNDIFCLGYDENYTYFCGLFFYLVNKLPKI